MAPLLKMLPMTHRLSPLPEWLSFSLYNIGHTVSGQAHGNFLQSTELIMHQREIFLGKLLKVWFLVCSGKLIDLQHQLEGLDVETVIFDD